jgi:hypothetical protein
MGWHRFETNDNKRRLEHTQNVIYPTKIKTQTTISYCLVLKRRMVRPLFPTQSHPCDTCCQAQSPLLRLLGSKLKFICAGAAEERSNSVNDPPRYSQFSVLSSPQVIWFRNVINVSADIFCAEITAGKSQRLKEITTAVGKSKHEF